MGRISNEVIGNNIKAARVKAGYKRQSQIAKRMGVSTPTICSMETKPMEYPIIKLYNLANAIGCPIDDFFKD